MADKKLIVGNWKMNLNMHEASLYVHKLTGLVKIHKDVEVVLAPTMLTLQSLSLQIDRKQFKLAAQNLYWRDEGTFTGEVSAAQLHGVVQYAIIGHSDRRHIFGERNKDIRNKVQAAIRNGINPILCVGDTASEKADGETYDVIHDQLIGGLANVTSEEFGQITIAYEPVWALSHGVDFAKHKTPTPEDVKEVEVAIRRQIQHLYGDEASRVVRILYGGSTSPDNAIAFLSVDGINGLLVGGASLDAEAFNDIIEKAHNSSATVPRKK